MLRQYLTNADIVATWKATSARMHATLAEVETESAAIMNPGFSWADEYKIWEHNFLFQQGSLVEQAPEIAITNAKDQITNNAAIGSQALRNSFVAAITAQTQAPGLADLSDWLDIDDAPKMP
ncbi:hypothetical protein HO173_008189 [Letharia columbiana]|uniref:Uncharacterized protein n=1 Tax=Letharia columbiana TaxID=112416 RepID=A0A8H6FS19_9LECA|nr:uncharacterized protein HO173_008189 [Letharia columbiana]KAF6233632.1 hypothetical protein HO173_008189 [Letharia columbiana]